MEKVVYIEGEPKGTIREKTEFFNKNIARERAHGPYFFIYPTYAVPSVDQRTDEKLHG